MAEITLKIEIGETKLEVSMENEHDTDLGHGKKEKTKMERRETIQEESASVKLQALTVAKNTLDLKRQMVNGENLHMSASKWIETTKLQQVTITQLREKLKMYLDAEPQLTISDFKEVEKNIKTLSAKNTHLEEKFNDLLSYLRTNSIEVPNL